MISPKGLVTGIIGICLLITIIITITAFIVSLSVEKTEPLSSPHVIVDENVLRWGRVKNAKEYIIYVNGEEKETTPLNSYYFGNYDPGNYTFQIVSKNDTEASRKSEPVYIIVEP